MSDAVVASWAQAEDSLYAPLLADPRGYERGVQLVGTLAAYLRTHVSDIPGLVDASDRGAQLVAEGVPDASVPWMPLEAALRAACAMRYREIRMTMQRDHRAATLRDAAASGAPWVRIVDPGSGVAPRVAPALLVHLRSGHAIQCATEMDPETGGARFTSHPVVVDLTSGDVLGPLALAGAPARWVASLDDRDANVAELQRLIEG